MNVLEVEVTVKMCPLFIEDHADCTDAALSFCRNCEYHKSLNAKTLQVKCGFPEASK